MAVSPDPSPTPLSPPQAVRIRRRRGPPGETSFDGLRAEGIRRVQTLSGRSWTDYNLHDPGVTILEALCYALTELAYRTDFGVADHLTASDGRIDYEAQGLQGPEIVLPCRPTTSADYRRALLDAIHTIDNAWVTAAAADEYTGLYRIAVRHSDSPFGVPESTSRDAALAIYRSSRNLCEDAAEVVSVADVECHLHGEFEIGGARPVADIAADIIDCCARAVAARVTGHSYGAALKRGLSLDEVLDGPHTVSGIVRDEDLAASDRGMLYVGDLVAQVRAIEGVRAVKSLALDAGPSLQVTGSVSWNAQTEAPRLRLPDEDGFRDGLRFARAGTRVSVPYAEVREKYFDLQTRTRDGVPGGQSIAELCPLPRGIHRNFGTYTSIQNAFPDIYGINAYGVPEWAPALRKAQAKQLKAYLALFEQILASGAAQLDHVRDLYSAHRFSKQSYWFRALDDAAVPGIGAIYAGGAAPGQRLADAVVGSDPYVDRRNRALDFLLALHGETFSQHSLRQQLALYYETAELEDMLLANKLAYLQNIVQIGTDRAGGFDYSKPSWGAPAEGKANCSGFQVRVHLLLGFRYLRSHDLAAAVRDAGFEGIDTEEMTALGIPEDRFQRVLPRPDSGPVRLEDLRRTHGLFIGRGNSVSAALLRYGADRGNYRIGRISGRPDEHLFLLQGDKARGLLLGRYATAERAWQAASSLRQFLVGLNVRSEGMHVVEHILLRPLGPATAGAGPAGVPASFYSLRMTAVFPAWTGRCSDPAFRRLAEETVQINCPAHVHPECLWLDFPDMGEFEQRYRRWLEAKVRACELKVESADALASLDAASRAVVEFLLAQGVTRALEAPPDA